MKQTSADYTFGIASLEIVLLLLGSFLLGMLLCWLLRKLGICCAVRKTEPEYRRASLSTPSTTQEGGRTPRKFPGEELKGGGYTADINSLLRTRDPVTPPASRTPDTSAAGITTAAVTASVTSRAGMGGTIGHKDDLKKLEGIGPKIEQVLNAAGIYNFAQLASMTPDEIKPVLEEAGNQFKMHDPKSWPYQAELANKGEWERLKEYQSLLIGGSI
jgi:predicted flap endonuclease-1-like 5' DNA nuclease